MKFTSLLKSVILEQSKFEVLESNNKYDKINTKSILSKKYPDYEITIIKISQSVTATSEII